MCSEVVVCCRGVGKAYRRYERPVDRLKEIVLGERLGRDFWALKDVDLEVRRDETLGVIGRNGAGKSTLLQLICGTLRPSSSEIEVRGRVAALLELGAGFDLDFTGRENVELSASVLGLSTAEIEQRLPAIEAFAGIGDFIDRPVRHYSSGMFARLAFAVCAHVDADILVIDEILGVGDAAFRQRCMRFLHQFRSRGTLLFVSHDEGAVLRLCERALWLEGGLRRELGPSREVCRRYLAGLGAATPAEAAAGQAEHAVECRRARQRDVRWAGTNPIEIAGFNPHAPWHGHGGARIEHAALFAPDGAELSRAEGGEEIELRVFCRAERTLRQPIVGFILRNSVGVHLLGDNTYSTHRDAPPGVGPGDRFVATFRIALPFLPRGEYGLTVAITEGTQADHIHLHWIEQAIGLRVGTTPVTRGELGVAMSSIRIEKL